MFWTPGMGGNCSERVVALVATTINVFDIRHKRRNKPALSHIFAGTSRGATGGKRK